MNNNILKALKAFKLSIKDILNVEENEKELTYKVFLGKGKGCLLLEGHTEEVRRKRQKDGSLSFFRIQLPEPAYRVRWNSGSWVNLAEEE